MTTPTRFKRTATFRCTTVAFSLSSLDLIEMIPGFVPINAYEPTDEVADYEWGRIEFKDKGILIRFIGLPN